MIMKIDHEKTCREYITLVMKCGNRKWTNEQIRERIIASFGIKFYNTTIGKNLSFMINEGEAESEPTEEKDCHQYWLLPEAKKKKPSRPQVPEMDPGPLMDACEEAMKSYPSDHPQRAAIMEQYAELESRLKMRTAA